MLEGGTACMCTVYNTVTASDWTKNWEPHNRSGSVQLPAFATGCMQASSCEILEVRVPAYNDGYQSQAWDGYPQAAEEAFVGRSRPAILQAAWLAIQGTQDDDMSGGPLLADKADTGSDHVQSWSVGVRHPQSLFAVDSMAPSGGMLICL